MYAGHNSVMGIIDVVMISSLGKKEKSTTGEGLWLSYSWTNVTMGLRKQQKKC